MDELSTDTADTQQLLERVRQGDREAIDRLFGKHRAYLLQLVAARLDARLRPRVDPSDIVQEAHLEALRRLPEYLHKTPMPFRLWLRQITHDRILKAWRRHLGTAQRSLRREVPLPDRSSLLLAQQLLAAGSSPSQRLNQHELAGRVQQGLAQLPEADREILLLRIVEGLSYQEVSYLLEIEPAAARKRQGRALVRLHTILFGDRPPEQPT
jgi:RNA polymerase sigma-70 factor (ECF subfamily)